MSIKGEFLSGGINQEIQGVTTKTRAHPDDFNPNVLKPLLDNDVTLSKQLEELPSKPISFNPGYQIVESEHDAPFRLGEIKGRTLVNLLGPAGACEDISLWSAPGPGVKTLNADRVYGNFSIEVESTKEEQAGFGLRSNGAIKDLTKHYIAVGHIKNISAQHVYLSFAQVKDNGDTSWFKKGITVTANQFTYTYVVVSPEELAGKERVEIYVRGTATDTGQKFAADAIALYEISQGEYDAIASMTPEMVASKFPYVSGITNVKNPYAIITGGNLLPTLEHQWEQGSIDTNTGNPSSYDSRIRMKNYIPAMPNTTYTASCAVGYYVRVIEYKADGGYSGAFSLWGTKSVSFTTAKDTASVRVVARFISEDVIDTSEISNIKPMLVSGSQPKPYVPQQRSMLAFEAELAAHPIDGSNPDTLFMGEDGLPYVHELWKKMRLDDPKLKYGVYESFSDRKSVISSYGKEFGIFSKIAFMTKYTGNIMGRYGALATPIDCFYIDGDAAGGNIVVSVSNTSSGWGPDYTPSPDDIKAYFLGWRMFLWGAGPATPFNGEGTRGWGKIYCGVGAEDNGAVAGSGTTSVPTTVNDMGYTPYRLQYLKANPTVEPVRNYELGATLSAGSNMAEVGSGIVIRERANPKSGGGNYYLHSRRLGSRFKHLVREIFSVYRNGRVDLKWAFYNARLDIDYGIKNGGCNSADFDPTAVYHVTYTVLDPTLATPISGTVAANLGGTVSYLVQDVGDVQRRLAVVETKEANPIEDTGWVPVTPISGWIHYEANPCMFRIIGKTIHLAGLIRNGSTAHGTDLFTLPIKTTSGHFISVFSWSNPEAVVPISIGLGASGTVRINSGTPGRYISFEGVVLLDESVEVKKS
ncbi:hypothetical protein QJQ58_29710 [Paenibacillus dendritiformis]|uniref:hypothetical protein n=1 Tax=Paenibacillus dendritiformis TaxID=130049 RepID=UPI00248B10A0|nr:hypothetical protein [Paenibacillus dendritiformis]WGU94610.1 hypothetical protein QJQ58_29710 [Paenibacillus dendritiformis]